MKGWRVWQRAALPWGHPSDRRLLTLQDGATHDARCKRTQAHLIRCPRCRERAAHIAEDWSSIAKLNAGENARTVFPEEAMVINIRASMHSWSIANPAPPSTQEMQEFAQTDAGRQVAAILETYLGRRAASALLCKAGSSPAPEQRSLAEVWPAIRILLGQKSAAAVEEKLLSRAAHFLKSAGRSSQG
jgi:hypothetical protein